MFATEVVVFIRNTHQTNQNTSLIKYSETQQETANELVKVCDFGCHTKIFCFLIYKIDILLKDDLLCS